MSTTTVETRRPSRLLAVATRIREANILVVFLLSTLIGMIFGAILITATTPALTSSWAHFFSHPGGTLALNFNTVWFAYEEIFQGSVVSFSALHAVFAHPSTSTFAVLLTPISGTLTYATPLILAGLGLAIGFRSSLFDIGGQGQVVAGATVATLIGFGVHAPSYIHIPLEMIGAMAAGLLLASIAGVLKAYTGAHEVIVTMMLNYVMLLALQFLLIHQPMAMPNQSNGESKYILASGQLPNFLSHLSSTLRLNFGLVLAVAAVVATQWFFTRSKTGFELLMVGQNPRAAETAGINAKRATIVALALAGAMVGLAGMTQVAGVDHYMTPGYGGTYGFDAITVALLGRNKPWGVFFGAIFFGAMYTGGHLMQGATPSNIQFSLAQVIQAVVVFCVATPALVVEVFKLRENGRLGDSARAGGWA